VRPARAQCVLVQRVHVDGLAHAVAQLERVGERLHALEEAREPLAARRPVERLVLRPRAPAAVDGLGAGEQRDLDLALRDPVRHVVQQQDRTFAATRRLLLLLRPRARELGHAAGQVLVRPRNRRDAADEVRLGHEPRPAGVDGGALECGRHQPRGLERLPLFRVEAGPVAHLPDADDDHPVRRAV